MSYQRMLLSAVVSGGWLVCSSFCYATNGMNMEGYGPEATAMGGASMAYDNGTAAMMNNPATLGLMPEGDRLDLFAGFLGPDVEAKAGGLSADSDGTAYYMPAAGWARKRGRWTFGLGVYGQGGMGTEYDEDTFLGDPAGTGARLENRTELSVGRVIIPLAYRPGERWTLGGSLDLVWAGLDLKMAMNAAQFNDLASTQRFGTVSGGMLSALPPAVFAGLDYTYFDFSNHNRYTGEARGYGYAGKLGLTYRLGDTLSLGAAYHSKTRLGNMKTDDATLLMGVGGGVIPVSGQIKVDDFQWPATWAVGMHWQATPRLTLVADIKRLLWKDVMADFTMRFKADAGQSDPAAAAVAGTGLTASLFQRWQNQTVYQAGGAYQLNRALVVRAGINYGKNPVPDRFLNALFPAIIEKHLSGGFGYRFGDTRFIDFSVVRALENRATNPGDGAGIAAVESRHAQWNFQFIYTQLL